MRLKFLLATFIISLLVFSACKKEKSITSTNTTTCDTLRLHDTLRLPPIHDTVPPVVCDVRGSYTGTSTTSGGVVAQMSYKLLDNNFITGSISPTGPVVSYGGYKNTCDSVILTSFYISSYYLLQAKITSTLSTTTLTGTFKNLTIPSDYGTFRISK